MLPKVAVFALGGTIASSAEPGGAATVGLTGADLLRAAPDAGSVAEIEVQTVTMVPSGDLRLSDLFVLRDQVERAIRSGASGVVVTQGTDTLEETAYAFELLTTGDVPVVFTGAMRNASLLGADGPANLTAAIRVAADDAATGLGVLVVFNDEIHASRLVHKLHTSSTGTFASPMSGPLGYVSERRVRIITRLPGRVTIDVPRDAGYARVALLTVGFDDDGDLMEAVPDLGYDGLVLAGFGGGHVPSWMVPVVDRVARRIPVVLASRTNAGEILRETYGFSGSETDLLARGLIPAAGIATTKARVLLRLLLTAGVKADRLAWCFEQASDPPPGLLRISAVGG